MFRHDGGNQSFALQNNKPMTEFLSVFVPIICTSLKAIYTRLGMITGMFGMDCMVNVLFLDLFADIFHILHLLFWTCSQCCRFYHTFHTFLVSNMWKEFVQKGVFQNVACKIVFFFVLCTIQYNICFSGIIKSWVLILPERMFFFSRSSSGSFTTAVQKVKRRV